MTKPIAPRAALALLPAFAMIAACGSEPVEEAETSAADDYAARINGKKSAQTTPTALPTAEPLAVSSPTSATPAPAAAAPGAYAPGTAADPNSACNANLFGQFLGKQPNAEVRAQIMEAATDLPEVRFITPGTDYIKPDPTHPRLNVMIAVDGVIRDIRCG
ncbi:MAG: hypothetical protein AAFZ11_11530 [Pseudomonadota bacterium]